VREQRRLRSDISHSTPERITVRGLDLTADLMGRVNLGDMAFLELTGRLPTAGESVLFNAMLVALVEHGITPNTLAARLTYLGAPEALQGAVAAGLLGLGSVFVGTIEEAAQMVQEGLMGAAGEPDLIGIAKEIVRGFRHKREHIPGLGHPIHRDADPRTERLFELAREHGILGQHSLLIGEIAGAAERRSGRHLPINVTGAIGALASDLGMPWTICRGIGVMARAIGLVAHLAEEMQQPLAGEVWRRTDAEASHSDPDVT
jgi:citrate synthase